MRKEDIEALLARLSAGARLSVVTVELPVTSTARQAMAAATSLTERTAEPEQARPMITADRIDAVRRQYGSDAELKLPDWTKHVPLSEREMVRAIQLNALAAHGKGFGRDHAALVVTVRDMEAYLAMVEAVERGAVEPPGWWLPVRRQAARRSSARRQAA